MYDRGDLGINNIYGREGKGSEKEADSKKNKFNKTIFSLNYNASTGIDAAASSVT